VGRLLNPAYKGEVIASNPATTGGAYLAMAAQIFRLGSEKAGFDYVKALDANVAQYTSGANGSIPWSARARRSSASPWVARHESSRSCRATFRSPSSSRRTPDSRSAGPPSSRERPCRGRREVHRFPALRRGQKDQRRERLPLSRSQRRQASRRDAGLREAEPRPLGPEGAAVNVDA